MPVGRPVGSGVGWAVGSGEGTVVGSGVGSGLGTGDGRGVGACDGSREIVGCGDGMALKSPFQVVNTDEPYSPVMYIRLSGP